MPILCPIQFNTIPSIRWDLLNAPVLDKPSITYLGHLPGSGVQRHSADDAYAAHGLVMVQHQSPNGRRLWCAMKGPKTMACHPRHDAARFMALALITGA